MAKCSPLIGCGLAIALMVARFSSASQAYHVGLDFIETATAAPLAFLSDFGPFPLTDADNFFVTHGGLAGWSEEQAQRAVALAVDDVFRDIDVGDASRTVRIAIQIGAVPDSAAGQRLNVAMGQATLDSLTLLGQASGDFEDSLASGTIVAAVYLDEIDQLGIAHLTYDTPAGVINSIAGVAAHEIGHVFGIVGHVNTSGDEADPLPIMATENTGLPTEARQRKRRFSTSQPDGLSSAQQIVLSAGTVSRGDVNLDGLVDMLDVSTLHANWGMNERLYHEGDVTGDQVVDAADISVIASNWSGGPITSAAVLLAANSTTGVPEPIAAALALTGWCGLLCVVGRSSRWRGNVI